MYVISIMLAGDKKKQLLMLCYSASLSEPFSPIPWNCCEGKTFEEEGCNISELSYIKAITGGPFMHCIRWGW